MRHLLAAASAVLALAAWPAAAQTMKPGLWEISNKMGGGQMDQAMADMHRQMAQMSPQQRKQMEAAMGQQGMRMVPGQGGAMAMQVCMTREMVERNDVPVQEGCTITRNQRTGNRVKYAFNCTNPPSSGEGEGTFTAESYTSRATMKALVQGRHETMTMEGSGRWMKADCGDVRPMQLPKK